MSENLKTSFNRVRKNALTIMKCVYDPFHDEKHALEVELTAIKLYRALPPATVASVNLEQLRLVSVLHDTSREVIGTNFLLEPLLGGFMSGSIAYRQLIDAGYSTEYARYIRFVILNHESLLGLWKYKEDTLGQLLSDADTIEAYSERRFQRGIEYFKRKRFSNIFLNMYMIGLLIMDRYSPPELFFEHSRALFEKNISELKIFFIENRTVLKEVLYRPLYRFLYSHDFLST